MWRKTPEPVGCWFSLNSGLLSIFFAFSRAFLFPLRIEAIYHLVQGEVEIVIAFPAAFTEIGAPVLATPLAENLSVSITGYHLTASAAGSTYHD
jgi:hypothetical protein